MPTYSNWVLPIALAGLLLPASLQAQAVRTYVVLGADCLTTETPDQIAAERARQKEVARLKDLQEQGEDKLALVIPTAAAAILQVVGPPLIQAGVNGLSKLITKAAEGEETTHVGNAYGYLYTRYSDVGSAEAELALTAAIENLERKRKAEKTDTTDKVKKEATLTATSAADQAAAAVALATSTDATINPDLRCISVIVDGGKAGDLGAINEFSFFEKPVRSQFTPAPSSTSQSLASYLKTNYGITRELLAYGEFWTEMEKSKPAKHWRLRPLAIYAARRTTNGAKKVALNVSLNTPQTNAAPKAVQNWTFNLDPFFKADVFKDSANGSRGWRHTDRPDPDRTKITARVNQLTPHFSRLPALDDESTTTVATYNALQLEIRTERLLQEATSKAAAAQTKHDKEPHGEITTRAHATALRKATDATILKADMAHKYELALTKRTDAAEEKAAKTVAGDKAAALKKNLSLLQSDYENRLWLATNTAARDKQYNDALKRVFSAEKVKLRDAKIKVLETQMTDGLMFVNIRATAILTKEPSKFLQALASAVSDNTDAIAKSINGSLFPDKAAEIATQTSVIETETTAKVAALTAIATFETARLTALGPDATKAQEITAASNLISARAACAKLALNSFNLSQCATLPLSFP